MDTGDIKVIFMRYLEELWMILDTIWMKLMFIYVKYERRYYGMVEHWSVSVNSIYKENTASGEDIRKPVCR